ncbi:MAG: 4-alpha-glucanotransferase [Candidatus Omnitrophica bacterium]|nr:4-alpha-glucanotransferase [Candidatus Omnitrophota bacterium]
MPLSLRDTGSIAELLEGSEVFLNDLWARKTLGVPTAISSLRSEGDNFDEWDWGRGDMGESGRRHISWLARNGFSRWMRLPNRKTNALFGDPSPYAARSAFAGEDSDIAVPEVEEFIKSEQAQAWYRDNKQRIMDLHNAKRVDALEVARLKNEALWLAMQYFKENHLNKNTPRDKAFDEFLRDNDWVDDYAQYMAISEYYWDKKKGVFDEINKTLWRELDGKLKGLLNVLHHAMKIEGTKDVGQLYVLVDDFFRRYYEQNIAGKETNRFRLNIYEFLLNKIKGGVFKAPLKGNIESFIKADFNGCRNMLFDGYERSKKAFNDMEEAIGQECMADWRNWDNEKLVERDSETLAGYGSLLEDKILFHKYAQFVFNAQEKQMKKFANDHGIAIEGDIPFYVSTISCETWVYKNRIFRLDSENRYQQMFDTGAPPDQYDREYGQNWGGTPYYINEEFKKFFYERTKHELKNADGIRIDHFRALNDFWVIPHGKLGRDGRFEDGPKDELLQPLLNLALGRLKRFFAEDLGSDLEGVWELMRDNEIKGFRVAIFGHGDDDDVLHRKYSGQIAFSGTHDTMTWIGAWDKWDVPKRKILLNRFFYEDIPGIMERLTKEQQKNFFKFLDYFVKRLKKDTAVIEQPADFQSVQDNLFTPLEKAPDEVGGGRNIDADGGLMPPLAETVRERSSLTGFTADGSFEEKLQLIRKISEVLVDFEELPFGVQAAIFGILAFSEADTVFLPMQDIFRQGEKYRINVPGKPGDWGYRHPFTGQELNKEEIKEIKEANKLMRMLAETSGRDTRRPLYKEGEGAHILGVSPGVNAKKMCKQGGEFIIWAAVQGDKPQKVTLLTNMPEHKGAYPIEQAVKMELVKQLSSGTYLYGVRIRATQAGKWGVAVEADNVRAGDVKENTSLVVTAQEEIEFLSEEQINAARIAAGISAEKLQQIFARLMPETAAELEEVLGYYQLDSEVVDEGKINHTRGIVTDLVYGNVYLLREKLLKADARQLNNEVHPRLTDSAEREYMRYNWYSPAVSNKLVQDLINISVLPGDPQLVIEHLIKIFNERRNSRTITQEALRAIDKLIANAAGLSRDVVFRKGKFFLLNEFKDPGSNRKILSFARYMGKGRKAIVISNCGDSRTHGTLRLNRYDFDKTFGISRMPGNYYALIDRITGEVYLREGKELLDNGLYFELAGYSSHVFMVKNLQDNNWVLEAMRDCSQGKALGLEHVIMLLNNFGLTLDFPCIGKAAQALSLQGLLNNITAAELKQAFESNPDIEIIEFETSLDANSTNSRLIAGFREKNKDNKKVRALCLGLDFFNQRGMLDNIKLVSNFNRDKTSVDVGRYYGRRGDTGYIYVNLSELAMDLNEGPRSESVYAGIIGEWIEQSVERSFSWGGLGDDKMRQAFEAFLALWAEDRLDMPKLISSEHEGIKQILAEIENDVEPIVQVLWGSRFDSIEKKENEFIFSYLRRMQMDLSFENFFYNKTNLNTIKNFAYFLPYYLANSEQPDNIRDILVEGFSEGKGSYYEKYFLDKFVYGALVLRDSKIDEIFIDLLENPPPDLDFYFQAFVIKAMHGLKRFDLKVDGISVERLGAILKSGKEIQALHEAVSTVQRYEALEQAI